jgi:hypothetical protein
MASILIVEKLGNIKATSLKSPNDEELYKKAGLKTNTDFRNHAIWEVEHNDKTYLIYLYGKTTGKANQENKYEFPPPVDKKLFFGNCILVNKDENNKYQNLTVKEWEEIYEILYGGFEDLDDDEEVKDEEDEDDDDDEDEDDEIIDKSKITKQGYLKDDFLVDDEDDEDYDDDDDEDDDIDDSDADDNEKPVIIKNKKTKTAIKPKKKVEKKTETKNIEEKIENEEMFLDCTSELSEDSYL